MFVRTKPSGRHQYLQIVESRWEDGRPRQHVIATLGRLDRLKVSGQVDAIMRSLSRFSEKVKVIEGYREGRISATSVKKVGPELIIGRLWKELGFPDVLKRLLGDRRYEFEVERAIYFTVLSRLFFPSSDRKALRISRDYKIEGKDGLKLHHFYRAMAWLGDMKDEVEEDLFLSNRKLFTGLNLVFFDTTSIYFEGNGGESLGQYGYSRDNRSDEKQMIVGAVIDTAGRPISCPMWPGNMADSRTLVPVVQRLKERFGVGEIVIVADRGMVSREAVEELEGLGVGYIFGIKMRKEKEVNTEVLSRAGKYREVEDNLKVKEVRLQGRRYIVCLNPEEAERDRAKREVIIESMRRKLKEGAKALIGNRGYRRYLKIERASVKIDEEKAKSEERFDGKYVLRTNTSLSVEEVALRYKELWQVERIFREVKGVLETRPVYHKYDSTIKGHVFCSFLALVIMKELMRRVDFKAEWDEMRQDIDTLYEVEIEHEGKKYLLRSPLQGMCGKVLKAVGVAVPPSVTETKHSAKTNFDR
ncbi:MAG: IS1634 family transposase [Nitrospirota bacterium]